VIVFANGDQLTGTLLSRTGNSVTFQNDIVGKFTVDMSKVKALRTEGGSDMTTNRKRGTQAPVIQASQNAAPDSSISPPSYGQNEQTAVSGANAVVDTAASNKEVPDKSGPFRGWKGTVTGGATNIQGTAYGATYTAAIALARSVPAVTSLPQRTRTIYNLSETYGKLTQPVIPGQPDVSVAKTSIFHTDLQHNKYFTPRMYALGTVAFDHNYSQGMSLQQTYGAGVGGTVIQNAVQQLDVTGAINYQRLNYMSLPEGEDSLENMNLMGVTFGETYTRTFPMHATLTQSVDYSQPWNTPSAYQWNGSIAFTVPVYHHFGVGLSLSNNYLNTPQIGYKKNSFQSVMGITYTFF